MEQQKTKIIYITLMRTSTFLSRMVYLITRDEYTHASIAFEESLQPLYSSTRKNGFTLFPAGPCIEDFNRGFLKKHLDKIPCVVYELKVTEEIYNKARCEVDKIMRNQKKYHFNIIGLFLCRINISYERERNYFCSQFVSDILIKSGALKLPKKSSLMRPIDYTRLSELSCCYKGKLSDYKYGY